MVDYSHHSVAHVPTSYGSRYLQQLCKHWSHNMEVEYSAERGTVVFPKQGRAGDFPGDALVSFAAGSDQLDVRIDGTAPEQVAALQSVVASHLDRFAFREAPLQFDWRD